MKEQLDTILESESALSSKINFVELSLNRNMLDLQAKMQEQFAMVMNAVSDLKPEMPSFSKKEEEHQHRPESGPSAQRRQYGPQNSAEPKPEEPGVNHSGLGSSDSPIELDHNDELQKALLKNIPPVKDWERFNGEGE